MFATIERKIIAALVLLLISAAVWFNIYRHGIAAEKNRSQNELAALVGTRAINDSLRFAIVRVSSNLEGEISKSSQLRKLLADRDAKILALANMSIEAKVESVYVPLRRRPGEFASFFDTSSNWFNISGIVDSSSVLITNLETRDSITVAVTKSVNDLLYGYVQNHSPFVKISNVDFALDVSQFIEKPSPIWKYLALGEAAVLVLSLLRR